MVISNKDVHDIEGIFYALMISSKPLPDEFSYELKSEMLSKPMNKESFVKCQLIQAYTEDELIRKHGFIKQKYFDEILRHLIQTVF